MDPADAIARLTGTAVAELQGIGGQHLWRHYRGRLASGQEIFAKISERPLGDLLYSEASGLRWMADAGAVPVPEVLGHDQNALVLSWVPPGSPRPCLPVRRGLRRPDPQRGPRRPERLKRPALSPSPLDHVGLLAGLTWRARRPR